LELAESGHLPTNAVPFSPALFEVFAEYWKAVSDEPVGRVQYPFWHLDSEPFWSLVMRPGFEEKRTRKAVSPSARQVGEWVSHVRLDDDLFAALADPDLRDRLRGVLVSTYFPERTAQVAEIRAFEQSVYQYTQIIRRVRDADGVYAALPPEHVRDAAFRRVVTQAYQYTCAVSRHRLTLSAGGTYQLVQAAHIRDWSDSHDDSPANGLALSPTYHWLFERGLFTLDHRWRVVVSPVARDCIGTVDSLLAPYHRRDILLPADEQLRPGLDYLDWHRETKYLAA
jgi:putative restriction endonuclease